jgi:hypothetical protein
MSSLGIGVDFRNGFGTGITEHVDLFARLSRVILLERGNLAKLDLNQ